MVIREAHLTHTNPAGTVSIYCELKVSLSVYPVLFLNFNTVDALLPCIGQHFLAHCTNIAVHITQITDTAYRVLRAKISNHARLWNLAENHLVP